MFDQIKNHNLIKHDIRIVWTIIIFIMEACSLTENEIKNYSKIVKGIAMQFGKNCEVVLHDYSKPYDSTIVYIANNTITGRQIGDCGTNLGLEILRGVVDDTDQYNYITQINNGRILRSSSIYLRDENEVPVGAICINYDITDMLMMKNLMEDLTFQGSQQTGGNQPTQKEIITSDINTLLDEMIAQSVDVVGVPVHKMDRDQKIMALRYLDSRGAFLIKKAGEKIAQHFEISKFTLYNYLDGIRDETAKCTD